MLKIVEKLELSLGLVDEDWGHYLCAFVYSPEQLVLMYSRARKGRGLSS